MEKINFEKFQVNEEAKLITFSCASDLPYQRYDAGKDLVYNEILVVSEEAVDLSRMNNFASVLFNHNQDIILGVVEKAWVQGNKVFCRCRFSENDEFATRIFKDMIQGIIRNISIGYEIIDYEDRKEGGVCNRYVTKWLIYQTSVVSTPADPTCGLRSYEKILIKGKNKMNENENPAAAEELEALKAENEELKAEVENLKRLCSEPPAEEEEVPAAEEEVPAEEEEVPAEEEEVPAEEVPAEEEEIKAIGKAYGLQEDEVQRAISNKLSTKDFKNLIKTKTFNINKKETRTMNKNSFKQYIEQRNFETPFQLRDFSGFAPAQVIGTETLPLVAALQKKLGVTGFRTISGLTSNITIPVQSGRFTVTTPGINEPSTDSVATFEAVTLSPKKYTASCTIGKQALYNTASDIEAFVINSILKEIAYKVQVDMLKAIAEAAETEINYASLDAITWKDILAMEAGVDAYELDSKKFVLSSAGRASLKGIEKAPGCGKFICEENTINGYEARISGAAENDNIVFGDFSQLVLGSWQDMEVLIDNFTEARAGNIVVVGSALLCPAVVQKSAFAIGKVQA